MDLPLTERQKNPVRGKRIIDPRQSNAYKRTRISSSPQKERMTRGKRKTLEGGNEKKKEKLRDGHQEQIAKQSVTSN